jgi:UDP-glucose 4-epimerase
MTRVVVVGGCGFIGRHVCAELARTGAEVVVVDRVRNSGVRAVDIAEPGAEDRLTGAFDGSDVVIHLAARVDPATKKERAAMRRLHVEGTRAVVHAARNGGARKLVLASSATVYGAWPENPVPLDEHAPVRPNPAFDYAVDKAEQERVVDEHKGDLDVAVARPAIVYGSGVRNYLSEILRLSPVLPALDGHRPPLQFVHVDDVARAFAHLALGDTSGVFNVASADWLPLEEVADICGRRIVDIPLRLASPILDGLARVLPPHLRAPSSMAPYLMFPFVVSSRKIAENGSAPRVSSREALRSILEAR